MKKKFKKGDKVRCVCSNIKGGIPVPCMPVYQGIYTWEGYSEANPRTGYLKEIPRFQNGLDTSFGERYFELATEGNTETFIYSKDKIENIIYN